MKEDKKTTPVADAAGVTTEENTAQETTTNANDIDVTDAEILAEEVFDYNGQKYSLTDDVDQLQVEGIVYLRKDIVTNKEIMTSLIVGNNPFVKKV